MDIPKFHETFIPILKVLDSGEVYATRELIEEVKSKFYSELTSEQLNTKTKSGEYLIDNRIAWGKAYLKKGGYIFSPERGRVKITQKGLNHPATISLRDLENENSIFEFYKHAKSDKSTRKEIENTFSSPQDLIDEGFLRIENEVKTDLLIKLKSLNPYFF